MSHFSCSGSARALYFQKPPIGALASSTILLSALYHCSDLLQSLQCNNSSIVTWLPFSVTLDSLRDVQGFSCSLGPSAPGHLVFFANLRKEAGEILHSVRCRTGVTRPYILVEIWSNQGFQVPLGEAFWVTGEIGEVFIYTFSAIVTCTWCPQEMEYSGNNLLPLGSGECHGASLSIPTGSASSKLLTPG